VIGAGTGARPGARLIRAATEVLRRADVESPRLDAEVLLAFVLGVRRFDLLIEPPDEIARGARKRFAALVRERAAHAPVAYLVGAREFHGLEFRVDRRVLVPRPETELLADAAIAWLLATNVPRPRVVDLGCGSGCLAVTIALGVPGALVVGTDVSPDALAVAAENVARLAPGRIELRQGDLFAAVDGEPPFDLVVSNPPYVASSELGEVDRAVSSHEPERAWLSGTDPIVFHRRILDEGRDRVSASGAFMLELGSGSQELFELARSREPSARIAVLPDAAGCPRVLVVDRAG
jgi:release factor glutamine methyltransferase